MSVCGAMVGAIAAAGRREFAYADLVMETGPLAWWPLDTDLLDRIGGRHGTIGAGSELHAAALPADSGGSLECAGSNWVTVAHASDLKPAVGSIMAWFRPASLHNGSIVSANADGQENSDFNLRTYSDGSVEVYFSLNGGSSAIHTAPYLTPNQIVHAIATFDSSGFDLYLDGNHITHNTNHTIGLTGNTEPWRFGHQGLFTTPLVFNGIIDEIAIWNRVLTRNEVYLLSQTEPDE